MNYKKHALRVSTEGDQSKESYKRKSEVSNRGFGFFSLKEGYNSEVFVKRPASVEILPYFRYNKQSRGVKSDKKEFRSIGRNSK